MTKRRVSDKMECDLIPSESQASSQSVCRRGRECCRDKCPRFKLQLCRRAKGCTHYTVKCFP